MKGILLAIDLAWRTSGYCFYEYESMTIIEYGSLHSSMSSRLESDSPQGILSRGKSIIDKAGTLLKAVEPEYVAYEFPDWHHGHKGRDRTAFQALGRAELALLLALEKNNFPSDRVIKAGTVYIKRGYGAMKKRAVAELIALDFPGRFAVDKTTDKGGLFDKTTGKIVTFDESDSMSIAFVVGQELHLKKLIGNVG